MSNILKKPEGENITGRDLIQFIVDNNALDCELALVPRGDEESSVFVEELYFNEMTGNINVTMDDAILENLGVPSEADDSDAG